MVAAHLNEPTIEEAHSAYLKRWHLKSVQTAWADKDGKIRKPSLAQYKKRFGTSWEKRQTFLNRTVRDNETAPVALIEHSDDQVQDLMQTIAAAVIQAVGDQTQEIEPQEQELEETPARSVKPENYADLPRAGQIYFLMHRAAQAGQQLAFIPAKRGEAAEMISFIKKHCGIVDADTKLQERTKLARKGGEAYLLSVGEYRKAHPRVKAAA